MKIEMIMEVTEITIRLEENRVSAQCTIKHKDSEKKLPHYQYVNFTPSAKLLNLVEQEIKQFVKNPNDAD